jgi:hypothetical protein
MDELGSGRAALLFAAATHAAVAATFLATAAAGTSTFLAAAGFTTTAAGLAAFLLPLGHSILPSEGRVHANFLLS